MDADLISTQFAEPACDRCLVAAGAKGCKSCDKLDSAGDKLVKDLQGQLLNNKTTFIAGLTNNLRALTVNETAFDISFNGSKEVETS